MIFRGFQFACKTTKFYPKCSVRNFRQKQELQYKICCVKSRFQNSLCGKAVKLVFEMFIKLTIDREFRALETFIRAYIFP